jgi:phage terminase large subunit-like protein
MNSSRAEKVELARALIERDKRVSVNPLKYAGQHAKQKEASACRKLMRALFWGNRVGKTEWGAQEVARVALGEHGWIPPGEIWACTTSYDDQKDTTQKKLEGYIPKHRILDTTWLRKGIVKEWKIDAGGGRISKIAFKSYEQGREKFQGAGKVLIWFDEEPPKDIFDECSVREEAGIPLFIILTMTPVLGMTWVYNEIYLNTSNPDLFISEAEWNDNPWLMEDQKEAMRRRLTPQALLVREKGKFVKQTGLVASWFNRQIHVVEIKEMPFGDTLFGLDFGFSNPAAGLYARLDRGENLWIFDGFYRRQMTTPQIKSLMDVKEQGLGRVNRVGDSAQASDIKQLNDLGKEIKGVEKESGTSKENWDEFRARLMEERGRIQEGTGKPKIFISSKLVDIDDDPTSKSYGIPVNFLVRELENLKWEEVKTELGVAAKPIWGKQQKHAIDALSYILASIAKPLLKGPLPAPTVGLVKPYPGMPGWGNRHP